jgi:hypothetical protein
MVKISIKIKCNKYLEIEEVLINYLELFYPP